MLCKSHRWHCNVWKQFRVRCRSSPKTSITPLTFMIRQENCLVAPEIASNFNNLHSKTPAMSNYFYFNSFFFARVTITYWLFDNYWSVLVSFDSKSSIFILFFLFFKMFFFQLDTYRLDHYFYVFLNKKKTWRAPINKCINHHILKTPLISVA